MSFIRKNTDIIKIVIHHTEDPFADSGKNLNKEFSLSNKFGSPYDIHINRDGSVDLSPQWIYAIKSNQYLENISVFRISKYFFHHPAIIGDTQDLKFSAVHIAVIGDFNNFFPTQHQLNSTIAVLSRLSKDYLIDLNKNLIYHNEVAVVSCPGTNFISKTDLIKACDITLVPDLVIQQNSVDKVTNPTVLNFIGDIFNISQSGDTVTVIINS
jgi:hypothetical protein